MFDSDTFYRNRRTDLAAQILLVSLYDADNPVPTVPNPKSPTLTGFINTQPPVSHHIDIYLIRHNLTLAYHLHSSYSSYSPQSVKQVIQLLIQSGNFDGNHDIGDSLQRNTLMNG